MIKLYFVGGYEDIYIYMFDEFLGKKVVKKESIELVDYEQYGRWRFVQKRL